MEEQRRRKHEADRKKEHAGREAGDNGKYLQSFYLLRRGFTSPRSAGVCNEVVVTSALHDVGCLDLNLDAEQARIGCSVYPTPTTFLFIYFLRFPKAFRGKLIMTHRKSPLSLQALAASAFKRRLGLRV